MSTGEAPALAIEQVSFSYGGPPVLEDVSLIVRPGEFLGIVGPNAGGKSTLLRIALGLLHPQAGKIRVLGREPEEARRDIGYVPQHPPFDRGFPVSVEQVVLTGRLGRGPVWGGYRRRDREIARRVMAEAEIQPLAGRRVATLSGGQMQRLLVARALACEPRLLILDEPTANIDQRGESDIFDLLSRLNRRMTIVVVSHDVAFISRYVERVACLNRTLVCHRTAEIDGRVIQELYGGEVCMIAHQH